MIGVQYEKYRVIRNRMVYGHRTRSLFTAEACAPVQNFC
jgi:hypothetical protein